MNLNSQFKTEKFETVKNETAIQKCLQYSDEPENLKKLLNELEVNIKFTGIKKHFIEDKEERLTGTFQLIRNNKIIEFDFGFSINDTEMFSTDISRFNVDSKKYKNKFYDNSTALNMAIRKDKIEFFNGLLYDCLSTCRMESVCPIDFDDFCNEFGYSNDSIQATKIFKACLKQSAKLQKIFSETEINFLPS
jgi:hypothetical protein